MKAQNIIAWVLVGVLAFLSIFQSVRRFDCSTCIQDTDTIVSYVQLTDTIFVDVETKVPVPHKVEVVKWRTQLKVDTVWQGLADNDLIDSILDDYYTRKHYTDTIADDYLIAVIHDVLRNNSIWDREFEYAFVGKDVSTITQQVDTRRGSIFAGPFMGSVDGTFGLGGSLVYQSRKDYMMSIHGDVLNKGIYFSTYWRLSFKRND